jgi:heme/copper-type cytochrome/quinol oxidase subunit 2
MALAVLGAIATISIPALPGLAAPAGQEQAPTRHEFHVSAGSFAFDPPRLEVRQDDLVKIVFHAVDMPHSFTIDAYRIAKRAGAGQTVVFEFRADRAGQFPFYCNLSVDEKCAQMKGELVVTAR